jgi:hypothetical protein
MKSFGRMPTVRTPEASRYARPAAYWNSAFPFEGKGSATSITFNFEAKFPFTFVSAYCLPVYASQWPLPDTTQDSVHGCWLSFTTVVISNYRISCACKAQPSQIPACGITAPGSSKLLALHPAFIWRFLESMKYARFDYSKALYQFHKSFPFVAFALTAPVKPFEK